MNTDNGSPMVRIGSVENDLGGDFHLQKGKVFQGGGFQHLHKMLDIQSGSEVLYVGDVSCASSLSLSPRCIYIRVEIFSLQQMTARGMVSVMWPAAAYLRRRSKVEEDDRMENSPDRPRTGPRNGCSQKLHDHARGLGRTES